MNIMVEKVKNLKINGHDAILKLFPNAMQKKNITASDIKNGNVFYYGRYTFDPDGDLERNWSTFQGGVDEFGGGPYDSWEDAREAWLTHIGMSEEELEKYSEYYPNELPPEMPEYRYHNGLKGWVQVHYEGLGGVELEAENLKDAVEEALSMDQDDYVGRDDEGDAFFKDEVVGYVYFPDESIAVFFIK